MLAAECYGLLNLWAVTPLSEAQLFSALVFLSFLCLHEVILLLPYDRCESKPPKDRELPHFIESLLQGWK